MQYAAALDLGKEGKEGGNSIDFRSVKEMPTRGKRKVGYQHDVAQTALHFLAVPQPTMTTNNKGLRHYVPYLLVDAHLAAFGGLDPIGRRRRTAFK